MLVVRVVKSRILVVAGEVTLYCGRGGIVADETFVRVTELMNGLSHAHTRRA